MSTTPGSLDEVSGGWPTGARLPVDAPVARLWVRRGLAGAFLAIAAAPATFSGARADA